MRSTRQVRLVALREITQRFRSRAYQVSLIILVVLAFAGPLAARVVPGFFEDDPYRLGVIPATAGQEESLTRAADLLNREIVFRAYETPEAAQAALEDEAVDAVLVAPDRLLFREEASGTLESILRQSLAAEQLEARATELGLTAEEARFLVEPPAVASESLAPPDEDAEDERVGRGIGALSTIVLLMSISIYGQWVLVGVIEEKSNRVVEVLVAAVATWELLVGKVLGIIALAMGQLIAAVAALVASLMVFEGTDALPSIALTGLAMALSWLLVGLLLYNFLYAAAGATVNRPEDATSATLPLMLPMMGGYFVGLFAIPQDPDSILARVISMFPLTAPLTMPGRIAAGGSSPVETAIAFALALVTLAAVVWLAARIYTGGVLQSSKVGLLTAFRRARDIR